MLDAGSLRAELDSSGPLTAARAVALIVQVAVELDGLAADGGLRSDIVDPANILLAADGSVSLAGPATAVESDVAYLAPERVARTAPVSAATDVYSLACILFECLTGRPPHADGGSVVVEGGAVTVPPGFDAVLASGLAANPGDRLPSAGAFAVAARRTLREGESDSAAPTSVPPVPRKQPDAPALSPHILDALSNPNIVLPAVAGYRSVTEESRADSNARRLLQAAIAVAVLLLTGVSIVGAHSLAGVDGTATGPKSVDGYLTVHPERIAVDKAGNIYIAGRDWTSLQRGVWKLAPGSVEAMKLPFPDDVPTLDVAVDSAGRIYVTTFSRDVSVLTPDTGEIRTYPVHDQGDLGDIAVDSTGNVFGVGTRTSARGGSWWVWKLDTATGAVSKLPFPDSGASYHVAIGPSGEVYATSGCKGVDDKFLYTDWVWKLAVGAAEPAKIPLALRCPQLLTVDSAGNLYVEDYGSPSTLMMIPAGWASGCTLPMRHLDHTYDLTVDQAGNLYGVSVNADTQTATLEKLTVQP